MFKSCFHQYNKLIITTLILLISFCAQANKIEYHLSIKNHLFYPERLIIPANKKVKLVISNNDTQVEEFDSFDLNREKVIFPKQKAYIFIGPLPAGEYSFFGEYHPHSARGKVVVVDQNNGTQVDVGEHDAN